MKWNKIEDGLPKTDDKIKVLVRTVDMYYDVDTFYSKKTPVFPTGFWREHGENITHWAYIDILTEDLEKEKQFKEELPGITSVTEIINYEEI
jgi:hypothetical protein